MAEQFYPDGGNNHLWIAMAAWRGRDEIPLVYSSVWSGIITSHLHTGRISWPVMTNGTDRVPEHMRLD